MPKDSKGHGSNAHEARFAKMSDAQLDKHFSKAVRTRKAPEGEALDASRALTAERAKRRGEPHKISPSAQDMKGMAKSAPEPRRRDKWDPFSSPSDNGSKVRSTTQNRKY